MDDQDNRKKHPHAQVPGIMEDQRAYKRVRVNMKLAYRDNDHAYRMGRVSDISRGGMFVDTSRHPDVDGYVIASLDVEAFGKVIWVQGYVARKTDTGMAICFTRTDNKGLDNLLSYWCVPF
jgi:Tfp pilus assembly protein PilZ